MGPNRTTVGLKARLQGVVQNVSNCPNRTTVGLKDPYFAALAAAASRPNRTTVGLKGGSSLMSIRRTSMVPIAPQWD